MNALTDSHSQLTQILTRFACLHTCHCTHLLITHAIIYGITQCTLMYTHSHTVFTLTYLLMHTHSSMSSHSHTHCTQPPDAGERSGPWMDSVQAGRWGGSYTLSLTLLGAPWHGHGQPWEVALPTVPHRLRQLPLARPSRSLESADSKARSGQARLVAGLVLACELFVFCLGLYRGLSYPKRARP